MSVEPLVLDLAHALRSAGLSMASAESCTGGMIAAACTAVAGSSDWFERGFVTYSNEAKVASLGVDPALLAAHGAVSEAVALAMATLVAVVFFASRRLDLATLDPLLYLMGGVTLTSGLHYLSRGYVRITSSQA